MLTCPPLLYQLIGQHYRHSDFSSKYGQLEVQKENISCGFGSVPFLKIMPVSLIVKDMSMLAP